MSNLKSIDNKQDGALGVMTCQTIARQFPCESGSSVYCYFFFTEARRRVKFRYSQSETFSVSPIDKRNYYLQFSQD